MSDVEAVASRFETMHQMARRTALGPGLVDFGAVLAAARPVGPTLDLASDLPSTTSSPGSPQPVYNRRVLSDAAPVPTGPLPSRAAAWVDEITAAADRHGVDRNLLTALVWTESAFRPDAVSPAGAIGLGQLMPGTAAGLGVDPHDPVQNLDGAARYLREQLDRFGSDELALAAYNAGPGRVLKSGGIPNISETQAYVRIVTARRDELQGASL